MNVPQLSRLAASSVFMCTMGALAACTRAPPPGAHDEGTPTPPAIGAGRPTLPNELQPKPNASATGPLAGDGGPTSQAKYSGPWFVVTAPAAAVYLVRDFDKEKKLGYVRSGGRVAVRPQPVVGKDCTEGWYELVAGGFICANLGTTDLQHPQVKFALRQPDLEDVLPYVYARNAKNGTPLYKSVPSREQMLSYEPYLNAAKSKTEEASLSTESTKSAERMLPDAGVLAATPTIDAGDPEPDKPWWQRDDIKDRLHEVKLSELSADADDVLARRMVAGFYVAVDKTFGWNGRTWYKTTKGLVAPADRFWQTAGSKFQGVDIDGTKYKLPIGWTYGGRKSAPLYEIDASTNKIKESGSVEVFTPIQLSGRELDVKGTRYAEVEHDKKWVKLFHIRVTRPGPAPAGIGPNERWVDVNLKEQTLVLFEGNKPIYATLVSSGKESKIEDKDHRTPSGEWRIREKHITTTMDGDGTAAGDLPYSIEDVPYVMYFNKSYALHGAFWHRNFGIQMSHGCVNLAPLDAKKLFFVTDPPVPEGWHGAWATRERPGSRVLIHE